MKPTILLDHDGRRPDGSLVLRVLLRVEGEIPEDDSRIPLNLSLVLDRSGSMAGEPLRAATEAAASLVRRLHPDDVVSVVAYDDRVLTLAEPASGADASHLSNRLLALGPGGMTNLSGGWLRGRELVEAGRREGGVNRVVLLTDGLANQGITVPDALAGLCRAATAAGVTTTTVGFGAGFDEALLRMMADAGGGATYYIERPDQAAGIFEEELEGLLSLTAQNLAVEVRPDTAATLTMVHHAYPSTELPDGLRLDLGDLYAREPRALLVELLVGPGDGADVKVATLTLHAAVLTAGGGVERRRIELPVHLDGADEPRVEPEVRREVLLLETARAREEALERQRRGDHGGAADALREVGDRLRASGLDDERLRDEAADLEAMGERVAEGPLADADAKYLYQRAYESGRGRKQAYRRIRREGRS